MLGKRFKSATGDVNKFYNKPRKFKSADGDLTYDDIDWDIYDGYDASALPDSSSNTSSGSSSGGTKTGSGIGVLDVLNTGVGQLGAIFGKGPAAYPPGYGTPGYVVPRPGVTPVTTVKSNNTLGIVLAIVGVGAVVTVIIVVTRKKK